MEQTIIDELIIKLNTLFPEINIYDIKMEMDVEPPLLQINCYDRRRRDRITNGGFFYTYYFEILYYPGNDEPELKHRDIELELTNAVWLFGKTFRADNIHASTTDGLMHLFFEVTVPLKVEPIPKPEIEIMQTEVKANEEQVSSETIKTTS